MTLRVLYHSLPILLYLLSSVFFYKIAHLRVSPPAWRAAWGCMTLGMVLLSFTRLFNIVNVLNPDPMDWLVVYQTAVVLAASALVCAGACACWRVLRAGSRVDGLCGGKRG